MRAYKTVNDAYIEPISFTVPRRAETFQSDIFPPAVGLKPAVSAEEWLDGKSGIPPKIDLESVYEGGAPVEVPADYSPSTTVAPSAPEHSPVEPAKPAASTSTHAPAPATVARSSPASVSDQKASLSNMASKFRDDDDNNDAVDADVKSQHSDPSAFDERPVPTRSASRDNSSAKPMACVTAPCSTAPSKNAIIAKSQPAVSPAATLTSSTFSSSSSRTPTATAPSPTLETSLEEIKSMLEAQTRIITAQSDKIAALMGEVETLKRKVTGGAAGSPDQSERVRQLELELEALRS